MTEEQIKHMVQRFLQWRLPENFSPDAGISFEKTYNEKSPFGPMEHKPIGTNLFDAIQAEAMVRHMAEGMSSPIARNNQVEIDVSADIEGKSVTMIPHGPLGEKARQTLALFAPVALVMINSNLVFSLHYNVDTDSIEMDAKL
jgi:hypothetical protein